MGKRASYSPHEGCGMNVLIKETKKDKKLKITLLELEITDNFNKIKYTLGLVFTRRGITLNVVNKEKVDG